jgi:O-succinylbenzoate synthase
MTRAIPSLDALLGDSFVVRIPLQVPFRGLSHREVMMFNGPVGPGEWAAFPEYSDEVAALWLRSALEQAFDETIPPAPPAIPTIAVNATFPALEPARVPEWWEKFPGVRSAKVKVGEQLDDIRADITRLQSIRETVGPDVTLRLDANARWSVDQAETALKALAPFGIDYVEQPVATIDDMLELKKRLLGTGIRLAADELIRQDHALDEVITRGASDIAVLKVSPLGGIRPTLALARQAHAAGLEVVISSGLETSVGLSWGARAAALLAEEFGSLADAGLGTAIFLETDIVQRPLLVSDGSIPVTAPELDLEAIESVLASPERTAWWQERLRRCLPLAIEQSDQ